MIVINPDQTLSFAPRRPGRSSLTELSEQRGIDLVNKLCVVELVVSFLLARNGKTAFPLDHGPEIYAGMLAQYEEIAKARAQSRLLGVPIPACPPGEALWEKIETTPLGEWRKLIVLDIGSSFNGPLDSYLEIAVQARLDRGALPGADAPAPAFNY